MRKWTTPFYGVSHLGEFSTLKRCATIEDHGSFVKLLKWFPGCGFSPREKVFDNVTAAQKAGERFVAGRAE